jgi:nitrate/nitrite transport system substrate-binding protein
MWLYYWLAAQGIHPRDARCVVIPGTDGRCDAGGMLDGFGWPALARWHNSTAWPAWWPTAPPSGRIIRRKCWPAVASWQQQPDLAGRMVQALLLASHWLDQPKTMPQTPGWRRLSGHVGGADSAALAKHDVSPLRFCADGQVNYPISDGLWFLQQYRRWGMWQGDGESGGGRSRCCTSRRPETAACRPPRLAATAH